jgi:hypothetical protein
VPRVIAIIVSARKATLRELQTFYSLRDAYDLLEIISVDAVNERRVMEHAKRHG